MYYKFTFTGSSEDWGRGFLNPEKIVLLGEKRFALKDGIELKEVENPTVEIVPLTDDELSALKVEQQIPDDWSPSETGIK